MVKFLKRRRWPLALLGLSLAAHFTGYLEYPPGVGGDSARLGIHTLDFLRRSVWPFYIYHIYAPNPLIVFLQAPLFAAFGFTPAVLRGLTVFAGALASPLAYLVCRALFDDQDPTLAHRAGVMAAIGLALSPFFQVFSRTGTEHMLLPALALAATACLWRGLRTGRPARSVHPHRGPVGSPGTPVRKHDPLQPQGASGAGIRAGRPALQRSGIPSGASAPERAPGETKGVREFVLAGLLLGLSQYSYIVARGFAAALAAACLAALLVDRRLWARWRGLALTALTALAVMLPQLALFVSAPPTFLARTGQSAGQFVFALPDPARVVGLKLLNQIAALGWHWETGYHPFSGRPLLTPVFFLGLLIAAAAVLRWRSAPGVFVLMLTALMFLPDLVTYEGLAPSATRISSAVPFLFILAGVGCAAAWAWMERRRPGAGWLVPALALVALIEGQWDFHRRVIPAHRASAGLEWKTSLVEVAEAEYVNAHADQPILIPSSEYQRAPLTFLLADRFPDRAGGLTPPLAEGDSVTVIVPVEPDRPTVDGPPSGYLPDQWVLLKEGTAYFLPPVSGSIEPSGEGQMLFAGNGAAAARVFSARWVGALPAPAPVSASFAGGVELVGYESTPLVPGQPATVTLYWRRHAPLPADLQVFTQILDRHGSPIASIHDWPLHGAYRASAWRAGEVVPLSYALNIPPDAQPGPYRLIAGVYDILRQQRVRLLTGEDAAVAAVLKIPLPASEVRPAHTRAADFGPAIHLDGYTLGAAPAGEGTRLALFWRASAAPDFDYTVFVHVVDAAGVIAAQSDSPPLAGQYPTSIWSPGETVIDERVLSLRPGTYQLFVGLYRWDTGERLPASVAGEPAPEDRVWLGEIDVP